MLIICLNAPMVTKILKHAGREKERDQFAHLCIISPAEGYRRLVGKQETGRLITGGSRSGTTGVHQVHQPEEAGPEGWER